MTHRLRLNRGPWAAALAALAALGLGLVASRAGDGTTGGDCPMFGGTVQRNMANTAARNVPDDWGVEEGKERNVRWKAEPGTRGYSGPVVAGGKVFVSTNNEPARDPRVEGNKAVLLCFREAGGQFLWQLTHDMPPPDVAREAIGDGLLSAPVVEGDRLYYVTPAAEVVCADTGGKVVWRLDLMKELKVFPCYAANCSPLLVGDFLYVVTGNGRDAEQRLPAPQAPSFVAVDKKAGKVAWQSNAPGDRIIEGQWANPAYAEVNGAGQVLFPGGDGVLYGFEPKTGKLLWKFDCNPKSAVDKPGGAGATRNALVATPVVADNKVYVGVGRNPEEGPGVGHLWCIDLVKAAEKGTTNKDHDVSPVNDNFDPKADVNKDSALAWHYGGPAAVKGARKYLFGRTISSCAVHDGLVYAAELDGFLHCLDARTGEKYWEHDLKASVWASPYYVDGKVYLGTDNGDMFIMAAGKEKREVRTLDMGQAVKCNVVVANGVLYARTESTLYAIGKK